MYLYDSFPKQLLDFFEICPASCTKEMAHIFWIFQEKFVGSKLSDIFKKIMSGGFLWTELSPAVHFIKVKCQFQHFKCLNMGV